jgi:PAS domain S-box-containing protein
MSKIREIAGAGDGEWVCLAFEQSPVPMALVAPGLRFLTANAALCHRFGYTPEELRSLALVDLIHPEDPRAREEICHRLAPGTLPELRLEARCRTRTGETIWGALSVMPLRIADRALATIEDVTERKRLEDALRDARARPGVIAKGEDVTGRHPAKRALRPGESSLRDLVDNSGLAIGLHDLDGRILSANASFARFAGYDRVEQVLGVNLRDLLAPDVRHLFPAYLERIRDQGHDRGYMRIVTRAGEERTLEYHNSLRSDGLTAPVVRSFGHDVTERRRAVQALRASEARYRVLYDDNPAMYFTVDPAGTILSVNRFGAAQLGYAPADLVGRPVLEVFHPEDRNTVVQGLAACLQNPDEVAHWEFRKIRRDGSILWVRETARAVRSPDGRTEVLIVCEDVTERRRAEDALRSSEARLRALSDNLPNGAVFRLVRHPDGRLQFLHISAGIDRLGGVRAEEVMRDARAIFDRIVQDDRPRMRAAIEESMRSLSALDLEVRLRMRSDQVKWVHVRAAPGRLPGGETLWDGIQVDVTEARRDLEALLQTVGAIVWDAEGDPAGEVVSRTFVSQQAERLLGYPIRDWTEQPGFGEAQLHPEDRQRVLSARREAVAAGKDYEVDYRMRARDGRTVWLRSIVTVQVKDDRRVRLRGITVDITESKRAEAALSESEQRFRTLAETMPAALLIYRGDRWVYANPGAEAVTGYRRDELLAMRVWDLVHPESLALARDRVEKRQRGEPVPPRGEVKLLTRTGRVHWIEIIATPILFQGQPSVLVTGFDITERVRGEAALRESEEALRQSHARIRDLAGQLMLTQEEERRRISRELHDDMGQKLAALAIAIGRLKHKLRESGNVTREQLTDLQDRTGVLLNDVRQLSHQLHPAALEHLGLVAALKTHCAEFSDLAGVPVTLTIEEGTEGIPPDMALCLYRVTQESLRNIAKHAGAREARVTLSAPAGGIELSITDTGSGFDPTDARQKGGLGLVSMEERVRLLGGRLHIRTQPGRTELRVHLPFAQG